MNKAVVFAACAMSVISCAAVGIPKVGDVTFVQDPASRIVTVSYTLKGADAVVTVDVRTNNVSIGAGHLRRAWGDVNRLIAADDTAVRTFSWAAGHDWPGQRIDDASLAVDVIAHPKSDPPLYMAVCLGAPGAPKYYYDSLDALPEEITASRWKTDWLLMRKIEPAGIVWRMGAPGYETQGLVADYSDISKNAHVAHESPHLVTLTNDYYIGVYPVTQRQYFLAFKQLGPESPADNNQRSALPSVWSGKPDSALRPVENIQWHTLRGNGGVKADGEAIFDAPYCWPTKGHTVNEKYLLGKMRAAFGVEFDLPTEAQWEFACRAGCGGMIYDWNADLDELAWNTNNSAVVENGVAVWQTHPVGLKKPNAFGLYDMLGNVQEWVLDFLVRNKVENVNGEPVVEPVGPQAYEEAHNYFYRVRKGGSFLDKSCRCAGFNDPSYSQNANNQIIGFRLCAPAVAD